MKTDIKRTRLSDDLELTVSPVGGICDERPLLVLSSLADEDQSIVIHLHEVRHLIEALAEAATELAGAN